MRFQTKIITAYAVLVFALALFIGFAYHSYTFGQYEKTEESNIRVTAEQLVSQMEERIDRMELVTEYLLSDPDFLSGIQTLAKAADRSTDHVYIGEAKANIREGINTYFVSNHFYRTIVFNQHGDVFATYSHKSKRSKTEVDFGVMPFLEKADQSLGTPILVNAHEDPWGFQENPQVFSLLKAIQGKDMGYIEVQYQVSDLEQLQLPKEGISYLVVVNGNELLFSSDGKDSLENYEQMLAGGDELVKKMDRPNGEEVLVAKAVSDQYPVTVLAVESTEEINRAGNYITMMTLLVALVFFLVSMVFVIILSQILTKPLRQLKSVMENTKLENIGEDVGFVAANDEIQALSVSYQDVLGRLQESIVKEQRLAVLQLQAQFDSLQAQVNPHFLYNVLNIISARGMSGQDEMICEMCGALASMLRYSTNNKKRFATIEEELEYLEQYFYLLKARYEHKIEFHVQVNEAIKNELIPKVALQQIIENCINHGFENSVDQMKVTITGWREENYWYIRVQDNGQGFKGEVLTALDEKMQQTRRRILKERSNMELEIGGMGLINTYARCLMLYNDNFIFTMGNGSDGADVTLGAKMYIKE